jgi:uncharacterized membrane protein
MADESSGTLTFTPEEIEDGKVLAGLGYLGILFILPLLIKPDNPFCKENAKQALVLFLAGMVLGLTLFGGIFVLIVQLIAMIRTLQGEFWEIPVVYDLASRFSL